MAAMVLELQRRYPGSGRREVQMSGDESEFHLTFER
jgi:hypothetical protein